VCRITYGIPRLITSFSPLKKGEKYRVHGLMFRSNRVDYLVFPVTHDPDWAPGPCWMPGPLFQILDSTLPPWRICLTESQPGYKPLFDDFGITALVGYGELISNVDHYNGIIDREYDDLLRFFEEAMKVEQWGRNIDWRSGGLPSGRT
jgi:hypothetical protein